jgi:hypothetical protein
MFYIRLYIRIAPPLAGAAVPDAGYVALVCIFFLFAALFQFGWGPVCWIYVTENPTSRLRSLNMALAAATPWLFQACWSPLEHMVMGEFSLHYCSGRILTLYWNIHDFWELLFRHVCLRLVFRT